MTMLTQQQAVTVMAHLQIPHADKPTVMYAIQLELSDAQDTQDNILRAVTLAYEAYAVSKVAGSKAVRKMLDPDGGKE